MISLVHISNDSKFLDCAIEQYDLLNNVFSVYLVVSSSPRLKYVKSSSISVLKNIDEVIDYIKQNDCDYVVLHGLFFPLLKLQMINKPFIWSSWGFDIYSDVYNRYNKLISIPLYKPLTRKFVNDNTSLSLVQKSLKYFKSIINQYRYYKFINKNVKYISTVFPEEFQRIQKNVKGVCFYPFRYLNLKKNVLETKASLGGGYILLGNSCDETNNHMDVLEKLESLQMDIKVIMPISYPENRTLYKKTLLEYVEKLKHVKVFPIKDFMAYDEYSMLLSQCSHAIFGHIRQQAAGNITQMLKMGTKVFMYKESMGYQHYTNLGCKVFSIDDDLNAKQLSQPISEDDAKRNRSIINPANKQLVYMNNLQHFFDSLGA